MLAGALSGLTQSLAIAAGGAAGALLRYWTVAGVHRLLGRGFPYGTLLVNVAGSFAIGVAYALLVDRLSAGPLWRAGLIVGMLGAFTTYSSFSLETLQLAQNAQYARAAANIAITLIGCLGGVWLGLVAGRQL